MRLVSSTSRLLTGPCQELVPTLALARHSGDAGEDGHDPRKLLLRRDRLRAVGADVEDHVVVGDRAGMLWQVGREDDGVATVGPERLDHAEKAVLVAQVER